MKIKEVSKSLQEFSRRIRPFSKSYLLPLFNTRAAGLYLILFAAAIGVATFIENDFGTSAAQKVIFQAWWFELLLLLFSFSILVNVFIFRMIPQKKWTLLSFHVAIVIILIGAALTRYLGFEGIMHIRENDQAHTFLSSNSYVKFQVKKGNETFDFDESVLFASLGNNQFEQSYLIGNDLITIKLKEFIPNPKQILGPSMDGPPLLKIVVAGANGREEYFIAKGETKRIRGSIYNFTHQKIQGAVNLAYKNDSLFIATDRTLSQTIMATQQKDTLYPSEYYYPLALRALYSDGTQNFVFPEFQAKGRVSVESEDPKVRNESMKALHLDISVNGVSKSAFVYGRKGAPGRPAVRNFEELSIATSYGSKEINLPFSLELKEFILEKYPGTNSASSYASEVVVHDPSNNVEMDYRIFMNHILNYGGYRFFQSSFDKDEKGTYLSVNSDFWGTTVSYIGYAILTLGMFLTFFSRKTRFYRVTQLTRKLRAKHATFLFFLLFAQLGLMGQDQAPHITHAVSAEHAQKFSKLIVQDFKGRMKPFHTLSREVLRKISRKESIEGLDADQVLLSMYADAKAWYPVQMIKIGKHDKLHKILGVPGKYAAYKDFFTEKGKYKLQDEVRKVYSLAQIDRGAFEKELLKVDERINIMSMVFSGNLLSIVPAKDDPNNTWLSARKHNHNHGDGHPHQVAENFFSAYRKALQESIHSRNYRFPNQLLAELSEYQYTAGANVAPSSTKIQAEILLNEMNVFTRLAGYYALLGMVFLFFLFLSVFKPDLNLARAYWILFYFTALGFFLHTLGLGIRWYVSGRAPWSNGYESMIYIAWTTTLAGMIFTRKSFGGLAATMVLAATILLVSTLSFLDPEITPLVPVLKSYWLTIHVSLEAGSYGFLMLGAIIGIINLILMIFLRESNQERIKQMIQEMTYISELTLMGGLFMISVGTYLGGVWANESWGRYWGWDAKETWALVTILIYAFILHMRIIPRVFGLFSYNAATIFGLASVIMTYYGVNYYLSGLHSYATGDPVPIPQWVYMVVAGLIVIAALAFWKKRQFPSIK